MMKKHLETLFAPSEIALLLSAVETFDESNNADIEENLRHSLCKSITNKLDSLNNLTYFSKQEFTLMAMSIDYVCSLPCTIDGTVGIELYQLLSRLLELAEP